VELSPSCSSAFPSPKPRLDASSGKHLSRLMSVTKHAFFSFPNATQAEYPGANIFDLFKCDSFFRQPPIFKTKVLYLLTPLAAFSPFNQEPEPGLAVVINELRSSMLITLVRISDQSLGDPQYPLLYHKRIERNLKGNFVCGYGNEFQHLLASSDLQIGRYWRTSAWKTRKGLS